MTADYTAAPEGWVISQSPGDGTITVTPPSAAAPGTRLTVRRTGTAGGYELEYAQTPEEDGTVTGFWHPLGPTP